MKFYLLSLIAILTSHLSHSQPCQNHVKADTISTCVKIEQILVDACANPEGANEMMLIKTGADNISVGDIQISWPNNTWRGFANATQSKVKLDLLNAEITNCGKILYPPNGIIPKHSKVLIFCSLDHQVGSHSFKDLKDTFYALFQNAGNTNGHFANFGTGLRSTTIQIANSCTDMATYDRSKLRKKDGSLGSEDGAVANFSNQSQVTYENIGCTPPLTKYDLQVNASRREVCLGDTVYLTAQIKGYQCFNWKSNSYDIEDTLSLNSYFVIDKLLPQSFKVYGFAKHACQQEISDSILFSFAAPPAMTIAKTTKACNNDTIRLEANAKQGTFDYFLWSSPYGSLNNPSNLSCDLQILNAPASFYVKALISNACGAYEDSMYIEIEAAPLIQVPTDTSICINTPAFLLTGTSNSTLVKWSSTGLGTIVDTNNPITNYVPSVNESSRVVFYFAAMNNCAEVTDSFTLTIDSMPNPDFYVQDNLCLNQFPVTLNPLSPNGSFSGIGITSNIFNPINAGVYTLAYVVSNGNCIDSISKQINVLSSPTAAYTYQPTTIQKNQKVMFNNNSLLSNSYNWFVEDEFFTQQNIAYTFEERGKFDVTLVAIDTISGCSDTLTQVIEVLDDIAFYIGNSFTPNGDSINDRFIAVASGYKEITMYIYNRWGELLLRTNDVTIQGWDGTYRERECPTGVYIYVVEMKTIHDKLLRYNGTIQLFR